MNTSQKPRQAMVLIVVLVAIMLLSLAGIAFSQLMFAERESTVAYHRAGQARAAADSGVTLASWFIEQDQLTLDEEGGLHDNPLRMQGVLVEDGGAARDRCRFTILAPQQDSNGVIGGIRYGLENESGRLNLNVLMAADMAIPGSGRAMLMALPGMSQDTADALLDWMDTDDTPREFGAEADEYSGFVPPYGPRNGPPQTVEELLLVRGVTPALLFGPDANRNNILEQNEGVSTALADSGAPITSDQPDGALNHGWAAYLTLYSAEMNIREDGTQRIDVNQSDLTKLHEQLKTALNEEWAAFIILYRQNGPAPATSAAQGRREKAGTRPLDFTTAGNNKLTNVLDLVGPNVQMTIQGEQQPTTIETPFPNNPLLMGTYLPQLVDAITVNASPVIPGRININVAPRVILQGIPGMTREVVDQIINTRDPELTPENAGRRHETWILSEGFVTLEVMKQLLPYVTCGGKVYRAQVVGYFEESGPASRIEVVLDATRGPARQLFWRDLTHLGRGHSPTTLGVGGQL